MRYTIGDVSRVLGMTTSALHFYEKEGIIDPPKEGSSGHRHYEDADVNRLISAKKYRAMGVSLKEIARQFGRDGMTGEQVMARMREKKAEAEQLAQQYASLAEDIDRLIDLGGHGLAATGVVDIRPAPDMMAFQKPDGGIIPHDRQGQKAVQRWLDAMPAVSVSILSLSGERPAGFALMMPAQRARAHGFKPDGRMIHAVRGGMALHAVVICGEEQYETPEAIFMPIVNFAHKHRFERTDALYGNMLFVDCSGGIRKHFYDTYMILNEK